MSEGRAGTHALALLGTPAIATLLPGLATGPMPLVQLRHEAGAVPQSTLRAHIAELHRLGILAKRRGERFPGRLEYELLEAGRDLLLVARVLERWLAGAPGAPLQLGGGEARAATKALAEGWSSTILRALASAPLSLTELDGVISTMSYPSLERRLAAMRAAGLLEAGEGSGRGTPCAPTPWLRRGVAPLLAAARWERLHMPAQSAPLRQLDIEAALLLALPLVRLGDGRSGCCRLGVELAEGEERRLVGALAEFRDGALVSCSVRLGEDADAWASGTVSAWLEATLDGEAARLELGGDQRLARGAVEGLRGALGAGPREAAAEAVE